MLSRTNEEEPAEGQQQKRGTDFSVERILAPGFGQQATRHTAEEERGEQQKPPPVWIYCSRFSARPTAGPRRRNISSSSAPCVDRTRTSRTAFTALQVSRLREEFHRGEYLSEAGRRELALELGLTEAQVKIWFQNARAKQRRNSGGRQSPLARKLAEAGLYNHSSASATHYSEHAS